MTELAPVALFVYNRPAHTRRTVECLAGNQGAGETPLYIFSDGPKTADQAPQVAEVRAYLQQIAGFKHVDIVEREENLGLARSIIGGVTELCAKYGKVIVVEDDLETAPFFLTYMNDALHFYQDNPRVMHISGCRYPADPFGADDTFFLHVPLCWGWATWQRAWVHFRKDLEVMSNFDSAMIRRFDFDNSYNYWRQLEHNKTGKLDTWFVFWYATLFLLDGLALFPARSLVRNIGIDGSGENSRNSSVYDVSLSTTPIRVEEISCEESKAGFEAHRRYFRKIRQRMPRRILRRLQKTFSLN